MKEEYLKQLFKVSSENDTQNIYTPYSLIKEVLSKVPQIKGDILVLYNLEFALTLRKEYNINPNNIWVYTNSKEKENISKKLGFNVIYSSDIFEGFKQLKNMKFDIIIGNPPYQQQHGAKRWTLWSKFIEHANNLSPKYLAFVIPNSWLGPNKEHDLIFKNLVYASLDVGKYFNVGSTFSYIICSSDHSSEVSLNDGVQTIQVSRTVKFIPNDIRFVGINSKFFSYPTFNFIRTNEHHTTYKSDWSCDEGEFNIFHSNAQSFRSNKRPLRYSYEGYKAIFTLSGYSSCIIKNNIGTSQIGVWMEIQENQIEAANSILNSKLYQKLLQVNKWSGWNSLDVIKALPALSLDKIWTDQEIYQYFNLTQEEIDLIEDTVK